MRREPLGTEELATDGSCQLLRGPIAHALEQRAERSAFVPSGDVVHTLS
jgi:hypothetical protein